MRIGIDGRSLFYGGGTQNYIYNLVINITNIDEENDYYLYVSETEEGDILSEIRSSDIIVREVNFPKIFWEQVAIPYYLKKDRIDIYHSTKSNVPLLTSDVVHVSTFHGMDFRAKLKYFSLKENIKYNNVMNFMFWDGMCRLSSLAADHIITVSDFAKQRIKEYYEVNENDITAIPLSHGDLYKELSELTYTETLEKYGIKNPYILCVSKYNAKKNIEVIINSLSALDSSCDDIELVLAGKWNDAYQRDIKNLARSKGVSERLSFLGFVPEKDLPDLYNAAVAFVFPSQYEGFGIPVVEAMACGTPVICSNRGALPEVVGEGAITIDPDNEQRLANELENIFTCPHARNKLVDAGRQRSGNFSWERTAKETLRVYTEVYDRV